MQPYIISDIMFIINNVLFVYVHSNNILILLSIFSCHTSLDPTAVSSIKPPWNENEEQSEQICHKGLNNNIVLMIHSHWGELCKINRTDNPDHCGEGRFNNACINKDNNLISSTFNMLICV